MPESIDKQIIKQLVEIKDKFQEMQYGRIEFIIINGQIDRVEVNHSIKNKKTS